jgi:hypothetical protein
MKSTLDMDRINEYARRIYENMGRKIAYNKIVGLLIRFVNRNGWDNVDLVDWESHLESGLGMDELVEVFRKEYPQFSWDDEAVDEDTFNQMLEAHTEAVEHADPLKQLEDVVSDVDFRLTKRIEELEKIVSTLSGQGPQTVIMPHDLGPLKAELTTLKTYVEGLRAAHTEIINRMADVERAAKANAEFVASVWTRAVNGAGAPAQTPKTSSARTHSPKTSSARAPVRYGGAIRLLLGSVIAIVFNAIAMPMLAYSNGWSDAQTFTFSMLTTMALIGLMILEGLWVNTVFSGPRKSARGFVAGYVYSQGVNPYKNTAPG